MRLTKNICLTLQEKERGEGTIFFDNLKGEKFKVKGHHIKKYLMFKKKIWHVVSHEKTKENILNEHYSEKHLGGGMGGKSPHGLE